MFSTIWKRSKRSRQARSTQIAGLRIMNSKGRFFGCIDLDDFPAGLTIGRAERCDVTIREDSVSRVHCRIDRCRGGYLIEDMQSRNGVKIATLGRNDKRRRVAWEELRLGSFIYLGAVILIPVDAGEQAPIIAWRPSEFVRNARAVYGDGSVFARWLNAGRSAFARLGRRVSTR